MVNPRLQKTILEVVENQIRENNPPETRKTLDRLLKKGYSKDDAMKLLRRAVLGEIYKVLKSKEPFDEKRYVKALRELR
jgi:transcriptional regulator of NAD metabolism